MYIEITPREWSKDAKRKAAKERKQAATNQEAENLAKFFKQAQRIQAQETIKTEIVSQRHRNGATITKHKEII